MNPDSRQTIHMGLNFVFSPMPIINQRGYIDYQDALLTRGIEVSKTGFADQREILVAREPPASLEVKVSALGPPSVAQLLILAPSPLYDWESFAKEAEAIVTAFESTWPEPNRQLIRCDVTLRDLYETSAEHAFQELWETRLRQPPDSLAAFGRPVLGGGLRFVMPPLSGEPQPVQIEVKIESFLRDTKKIFVETQFVWLVPSAPGTQFDPVSRLRRVDDYVEHQVLAFILGGSR